MHSEQNIKDTGIISFLVEDRYRIVRHLVLLLWLSIIFYNSKFMGEFADGYKWYVFLTVMVTFVVMIYTNMYILVPQLFFKGKYLLYIISLFIIVMAGIYFMVFIIGHSLAQYNINKTHGSLRISNYFSRVTTTMLLILITTTVKLIKRWIRDSERISELKTLNYTLELNELKNQITPHFLFNMLNNIKALIRQDQEKAIDILVKLSDILRFQLYETGCQKILLASEISFIDNFLSLEKIRRDHFDFKIRTNDEALILKNIEIVPNLFMPFVENAIRHSNDVTGNDTFISIKFFIGAKKLRFSCINSIPSQNYRVNNKYNGQGLKNIKRRLELLYYEDEYQLEIFENDKQFMVILNLPL